MNSDSLMEWVVITARAIRVGRYRVVIDPNWCAGIPRVELMVRAEEIQSSQF